MKKNIDKHLERLEKKIRKMEVFFEDEEYLTELKKKAIMLSFELEKNEKKELAKNRAFSFR